jgi:hypothetical protein
MPFTTRLLTGCLALFGVGGLQLTATTQFETRSPLRLVVVMGHSRYTPAEVLKTAGLAVNARVTPSEMMEACRNLAQTGLFEKVDYRYTLDSSDAGGGYQLTLKLVENPKLYQVRIAVPGIEEADLWAELKQRSPLFRAEMPISSEAWFVKTLQQVLQDRGRSEHLNARLQTDPGFTGKSEVIVSPNAAPEDANHTLVSFHDVVKDDSSGHGTAAITSLF